jgi:integrase
MGLHPLRDAALYPTEHSLEQFWSSENRPQTATGVAMAGVWQVKGKWKCQIRKEGFPSQSKTFTRKADAIAWGREIEAHLHKGIVTRTTTNQTLTVREMLARYLREESVHKASHVNNKTRSRHLCDALGAFRVHTLTSLRVAQYKRDRLALVGPQTVTHELNLLHRAYVIATQEWGIVLPEGIPKTKRPPLPKGRDRRASEQEIAMILVATGSPELGAIVQLAVETAMRRGELLSIRWEYVDLGRRSVYLPKTKTDTPRTVPLSSKAVSLLQGLRPQENGPVFRMAPSSASQAFERAAQRAGIENLHFHDLRHEATSRLFERGLNVIEVARITGHKTLSMLDRYTHLDVQHLAQKLG